MSSTPGVLDRVGDASSILLLAPSFDAVDDEACIDLLTPRDPGDENVLSVAVSATADDRLAVWKSEAGEQFPERAAIVDVGRSAPPSGTAAEAVPSVTVDVLPPDASVLDLAMTIARRIGAWESTSESTVVCLHSVTALLESFEREEVTTLVAALNDLCACVGAVAHHHLDPGAHADETIAAFRPLYDAVLEPGGESGLTATETRSVTDLRIGECVDPARSPPDDPVSISHSFDTVVDLVSAPRRRAVLYHLVERSDDSIPLDRLVDGVIEREAAIPGRSRPDSRRDVRISLVHTHLPKLAASEIVSYDSAADLVRYYPDPALESCIEYVRRLDLG